MLTWPGLDAVRPLLLWASQLNSADSLSPAGKTQSHSLDIPKPSQSHLPALRVSFLSLFSLPPVLPVSRGDPRLQLPHSHAGGTRVPRLGRDVPAEPLHKLLRKGCFPSKRGKAESRTAPAMAWSDDLELVKDCSNPPADGKEGNTRGRILPAWMR